MVLKFIKCFLCIWWNYHMIFVLQFLDMMHHIYRFLYVNHPCMPGMEPTWSRWTIWCIFVFCWLIFCWRSWCQYSWRISVYSYLSLLCLYLHLALSWHWSHITSLEKLHSLLLFWKGNGELESGLLQYIVEIKSEKNWSQDLLC